MGFGIGSKTLSYNEENFVRFIVKTRIQVFVKGKKDIRWT